MKIELNLAAWLDPIFHADFDVRSINRAPLKIKGEVVTRGILLYSADESFRVSFEVDTRKRYFDFLPALKYMRRIYLQSVKERGLIDTTTER